MSRATATDEKSSMKEDILLALDEETTEEKPRIKVRLEKPDDRIHDFREVEIGLTREDAYLEAVRCLRCDLEGEIGENS